MPPLPLLDSLLNIIPPPSHPRQVFFYFGVRNNQAAQVRRLLERRQTLLKVDFVNYEFEFERGSRLSEKFATYELEAPNGMNGA